MKSFNIILVLMVIVPGLCFCEEKKNEDALTAEEIKAIAAKPDDRSKLTEELKIYPDAKEYKVEMTQFFANGGKREVPSFKAEEKWVDGKYIVSIVDNEEGKSYMVVSYNKDKKKYVKNILHPNRAVNLSYGELLSEKGKTVRWILRMNEIRMESVERHSPTKTEWNAVIYRAGGDQVLGKEHGVAEKVK